MGTNRLNSHKTKHQLLVITQSRSSKLNAEEGTFLMLQLTLVTTHTLH